MRETCIETCWQTVPAVGRARLAGAEAPARAWRRHGDG